MIKAPYEENNTIFISCEDITNNTDETNNESNNITTIGSRTKNIEQCIRLIVDVTRMDNLNDNYEYLTSDEETYKSMYSFVKEGNVCLDEKQTIAYEIMCSSYILKCLDKYKFINEGETQVVLEEILIEQYGKDMVSLADMKTYLEELGGREDLFMFLSGSGGSGKSLAIKTFRKFCKYFCGCIEAPFDETTFRMSAVSGSAAALIGGGTLHSVASINSKRVERDEEWDSTIVLVVDEISMMTDRVMELCDQNLRKKTGVRNKLFGGVLMIVIGDFGQLPPCDRGAKPLYKNQGTIWNSINSVIYLENKHRFKEDPEWGEILSRLRIGETTEEDLDLINERCLTNGNLHLPDDKETRLNTCYACPTNLERNAISASIFEEHVRATHPLFGSHLDPPSHTLIIEAIIGRNGKPFSRSIQNHFYDSCGDHHVKTSGNKHVDPSLKLYTGCPLMVNNNANLVRDGCGNGTLCRLKGVKLKEGKETYIKNVSGYKVNAVSVGDVEYIICEHWESFDDRPPSTFHVPMMSDTVKIQTYINGSRIMLNGIQIKQLGVNINIATTGHKLQGMSKDVIIVVRNEKWKNWLYVVLSRVKTRKGLFLYRKLNMSDIQEPDPSYLKDEARLKELEQQVLASKQKK